MTDTTIIELHDYHPGEYTRFSEWAQQVDLGENAAAIKVDTREIDTDEDWDFHWLIEADARGHLALWHRLLTDLASPAWDWYGMGGDDHCYDYWPNTMTLAKEYLEQILPLLDPRKLGPTPKELKLELERVRAICRARYGDDGAYFDAEILAPFSW